MLSFISLLKGNSKQVRADSRRTESDIYSVYSDDVFLGVWPVEYKGTV